MSHIKNSETGDLIEVSEFPRWVGGMWECGSQRFTDPDKSLYEAVPDPEPVPNSITRFQAKAALADAGLLDQVETIMSNPDTPVLARLAWNDALEFFRDSPTVSAIAVLLSLSEAQVDSLFIVGAGISV